MDRDAYKKVSFWLEDALAGEPGADVSHPVLARPALTRSTDVDVAVLGGGFSGLWTAYYLLRAAPGLRVAVAESEIVGYGASGRNGGWCSPRFPLSAAALADRYGVDKARATFLALQGAVDSIQQFCEEEGVEAGFRAAGTLTVARGKHQLASLKGSLAAYERVGLGDHYTMLSPEQMAERVRVTDVYGGLYTPDGASLHPGKLVRGLARAVEKRGGVIYEQTRVTDFSSGRLVTEGGEVRAAKAVVLTGEAYLTRLRKMHRALLPVYSLISLTEPLTEAQWKEIGWERGENLSSTRNTVVYLTRTPDGRILFGSRGAPYEFGSVIRDGLDTHEETHTMIQDSLREWFPSLAGVKFTHAWGGPVGMPMDWTPSVRFDARTGIGFAGGYTGQGVSTTNLAGRILAGLILGEPSELDSLPFVQRKSPDWIPEPLRWAVVRYMQGALERIDLAQEAGRKKPADAWIAERLGRH
jgi:glycine/D-amino acid oxidase-like deaminating enzyme